MPQVPELLEIRESLLAAAARRSVAARRRRRRARRAGPVVALVATAALASAIAGAVGVGPLAGGGAAPVPIVAPGASAVATDLPAAPLADPASPLARAVTRLAASVGAPSGDAPRTVLTGLGSERWSLAAITTAQGAVCVSLGGATPLTGTCFPGFTSGTSILYDAPGRPGSLPLVYGIARSNVTKIDVHYASTEATATLQHGFFFLEGSTPGRITEIDAVLADGSTQAITLTPPPPPPAP